MLHELRASLVILAFFTLMTGFLYPLAILGVGQTIFHHKANGSLIEENGKIIGSELIGQKFSTDKYFLSRPSAAGDGYDASNSSGSNLAPSASDLIKTITERASELHHTNTAGKIPVDLVTASGSGLDPDISVASAQYQASHVADIRGLPIQQVQSLISQNITSRDWGFLGEQRVNVVALNRALDKLTSSVP